MDNSLFQIEPLAPLTIPADDDTELFVPKGVCAKLIRFAVEDNCLTRVSFTGGCDGNLKAISALVEGMPVEQVFKTLKGLTCGKKSTSCADQLCKGLEEYLDEE